MTLSVGMDVDISLSGDLSLSHNQAGEILA